MTPDDPHKRQFEDDPMNPDDPDGPEWTAPDRSTFPDNDTWNWNRRPSDLPDWTSDDIRYSDVYVVVSQPSSVFNKMHKTTGRYLLIFFFLTPSPSSTRVHS